MKRKSLVLMAVIMAFCLAAMFAVTGCGPQSVVTADDAEETEEVVTEEPDSSISEGIDIEDKEKREAEAKSEEKEVGIGESKAKNIALDDAGFSEDDVEHLDIHIDYEGDRAEYEVEFIHDREEYEYTIDAESGDILEKNTESTDN